MLLIYVLFRLYNLKDHRELGALMQHEGENYILFKRDLKQLLLNPDTSNLQGGFELSRVKQVR